MVVLVLTSTEISADSKQYLAFSMYVLSSLNDGVQGISKPPEVDPVNIFYAQL